MEQYFGLIPKPRWQDVLDILIVAYVIYRIALLIRGTRTMQMVVGLLVVAALSSARRCWACSRSTGCSTTSSAR